MTAMDTQTAAMDTAADQIKSSRELFERVEKMATESANEYAELMKPYLEETEEEQYEEEFEDTLERKYWEGYSDAAGAILDLLKNNLERLINQAENEGGQNVLEYLSEIFEGVAETDIWSEYFTEGK